MVDNEGSSNEQQDNPQVEQELNPWLQKRLEERAHPLASLRLSIGKSSLISKSHQQLLRLGEGSYRLVRAVLNYTGLASALSRVDRLSFLSESFRRIISRTANAGSPNRYEMLDLPWFRPKSSSKNEPVDNAGFIAQQEMTSDSINGLDDAAMRSPVEPGEEKRGERPEETPEAYISRMVSPPITRKTVMNIGNYTPSAARTKGSPARTDQMAESTQTTDTGSHKYRVSRVNQNMRGQAAEREAVPDSFRGRKDRTDETSRPPLPHRDDRGERQVITSSDAVKNPEIFTKDDSKEKESQAHPVTDLFYRKPLPIARKIVQSLPFVKNTLRKVDLPPEPAKHPAEEKRTEPIGNYQPLEDLETIPTHGEGPGVMPDNTGLPGSPDANKTKTGDSTISRDVKETGHEGRSVELPKPEKPGITGKDVTEEDISHAYPVSDLVHGKPLSLTRRGEAVTGEDTIRAYPAKDLFYRKPVPLARRIVQSLPFVKNALRKVALSPEPAKHPAEEKHTTPNSSYEPLKDLEIVPAYSEGQEVMPDNTGLRGFPDANKPTTGDSTISRDVKETGHEGRSVEPPKLEEPEVTGEVSIEEYIGRAYPVKDLVHRKPLTLARRGGDDTEEGISNVYPVKDRKPLPVARRILQSLAPVKNVPRKVVLPPEPIKHPAGEKQTTPNESYKPLKNLETVPVYEVDTNIYQDRPAPGLPLTTWAGTARETGAIRNGVLPRGDSRAIRDFRKPTNGMLDLTPAAVSRIPAIRRQEEYPRTSPTAERMAVQLTEQTQDTQTPTSGTSQTSTTEPYEESSSAAGNTPDLRTLAREIYPFIRRMIIIEKERRPSR